MSLMGQRHTLCFTLLTAAVLGLSACTLGPPAGGPSSGGSSNPAKTATPVPAATAVYQLMLQSGAAATSVHVIGDYTDNGQPLQLDVAGDRAGVTMRLLVDFGTGGIEILKVNDDFFLKAGATFWTRLESAAAAQVAAGKYVKVASGSAAGMGDFRVGMLLDHVFAEVLPGADELNTTVQVSEVGGVPAYLMTTTVAGDAKIYVSADGLARLLRTEGAKTGTLAFTEWSSVEPVVAPAQDQRAIVPGL
jgi:hypothetical protein